MAVRRCGRSYGHIKRGHNHAKTSCYQGSSTMIKILPELMEKTACSNSPLSPWERVGVRVRITADSQWKRLRRFPRYGIASSTAARAVATVDHMANFPATATTQRRLPLSLDCPEMLFVGLRCAQPNRPETRYAIHQAKKSLPSRQA